MRLRSSISASREDVVDAGSARHDPLDTLTTAQLAEVTALQGGADLTPEEAAISLGYVSPDMAGPGIAVLDPGDDRVDAMVTAAFDLDDPLAQSVRSLRGAITALRLAEGRPVRTLAILSVEAATEATIIAANLGVVFAQARYQTLLVDTNLRSPSLHALFRTANDSGVSSLLADDIDGRSLPQSTALPALSVLGSGPSIVNAPELFERHVLARKLVIFEDSAEMVIVDAGQAETNAPVIVDGLDAAVIVVRQHVSSLGSVQQLISAIEERGTKVCGTIFST